VTLLSYSCRAQHFLLVENGRGRGGSQSLGHWDILDNGRSFTKWFFWYDI